MHNPIELTVKKIPQPSVARLHLHPDDPERGFRRFEIKPKDGCVSFLVSSDDADILKSGRNVRLMGLFNIRVEKVKKGLVDAAFHSESHEEARKLGAPLIHWIPVGTGVPCEVVMPDASVAEGMAEDSCKELHPNDIIQFERFGFVRVGDLNKKLVVYFAHR